MMLPACRLNASGINESVKDPAKSQRNGSCHLNLSRTVLQDKAYNP